MDYVGTHEDEELKLECKCGGTAKAYSRNKISDEMAVAYAFCPNCGHRMKFNVTFDGYLDQKYDIKNLAQQLGELSADEKKDLIEILSAA